ncbi:MAG TPA: polysaccharide biosynthesis/export family protein [Candidatus Paceibacterota bacterium]|nr:polysaccharide biosynthesis/export family protein [Candidatus Paceibacterota bacterium]
MDTNKHEAGSWFGIIMRSMFSALIPITLLLGCASPQPDFSRTEYLVQPGDCIMAHFTFRGVVKDFPLVIDADGYIFPPDVPKIKAAGITLLELQNSIEEAYSRWTPVQASLTRCSQPHK